jgi:hypothetical protein
MKLCLIRDNFDFSQFPNQLPDSAKAQVQALIYSAIKMGGRR